MQNKIYNFLEKDKNIGEKFKAYRKKWEKCKNIKDVPNYPLHLNFELVSGCNLNCDFCVHSLRSEDKKINKYKIPFKKYCEIIDEGLEKGLCSIELNGINEPFVQKNVDEYIGYAMKKGIIVSSLHTNGILLTEQISQSLIDSGLTLIIFSIDAINEGTYQEIRRNKDYNKIIKNIYKLIELKQKTNSKFPFIRVSFSKNKVNYRDLPQFIKYWEDKIDDISISSFCNPFVGKRKYYEMEEIYRLESSYLGTCYEPNQRLIVFSNGNVGPCCSFFAEELIVGNIYKDSIYDIWNGVQMEDIRLSVNGNILQQTIVCRKCRFSKVDNFLENN